MSFTARLKSFYLCFLSSPKSDRVLFKAIRKAQASSIVEIGMGSILRSQLLIEQAQHANPDAKINFTAIDLFDSRPFDLPQLKLIETHRTLCKTGATIKLVPGEENSALPRVANGLANTDLLLISTCSDLKNQTQLWFYLPRMLNKKSQVFRQIINERGHKQWRKMSLENIHSLSQSLQRDAA